MVTLRIGCSCIIICLRLLQFFLTSNPHHPHCITTTKYIQQLGLTAAAAAEEEEDRKYAGSSCRIFCPI